MSSVAARLSPPGEAAYAASKAAISAWAECMKVDLRDTDVKIHVVYPGIIDTELFTLPDNDPRPDHHRSAARSTRSSARCSTWSRRARSRSSVPDWFPDVYAGKYKDVAAFLDGTIAYVRRSPKPQ